MLQNAFEALRSEVEGLRGALSHEQALAASLLEAQTKAELDADRLQSVVEATVRKVMQDEVAELRDKVGVVEAAVRTVMQDVVAEMHDKVAATVEGLRSEIEALRTSRKDDLAGFQSLVAAAEAKSVSPAALNRSEAGTRKAFRATLHEELHPLVEVVAESVAQSEFQLQTIDRKIEKLNESGGVARRSPGRGDGLGGGARNRRCQRHPVIGHRVDPAPAVLSGKRPRADVAASALASRSTLGPSTGPPVDPGCRRTSNRNIVPRRPGVAAQAPIERLRAFPWVPGLPCLLGWSRLLVAYEV